MAGPLEDFLYNGRKSSSFCRSVAKVGPETPSDRPDSSYSAGHTKKQFWRPHLVPFRGHVDRE